MIWVDTNEGLTQLYDVASQAPIGPLLDVGDNGAFLEHGDSYLFQENGSILEMTLDPARWRDQACLAAGRNLTVEEWATHIGGTPRPTCPQWPAPTQTDDGEDGDTTTTVVAAPTSIEATGALLAEMGPTSAVRQADGSELVVQPQALEGDLVGDLISRSHILVDGNPLTFTVFENISTFTGTIEGVGTGTLTFTTTAPENAYDEATPTVETGTVTDGTGDLAGYEGTIEMTYILLYGGAIENGTYTVTLDQVG